MKEKEKREREREREKKPRKPGKKLLISLSLTSSGPGASTTVKLCPSSACRLTCAAMAASRWLSKNTKKDDVGLDDSAAARAVEILASSPRTRPARASIASTVGGARALESQRSLPVAAVLSLIVGLRASATMTPFRAISPSKRASAASSAAQARSHLSSSRSTSLWT